MSKNVVESVIASIIFAVLWATATLILHDFGLNSPIYPIVVLLILLAIIFVYFIAKNLYPRFTRWLTWQLLTNVLSAKNNGDTKSVELKNRIIDGVFSTLSGSELSQYNRIYGSEPQIALTEFENQVACEPDIQRACEKARKIKILTIRGEKYFLGHRSLLRDMCLEKHRDGYSIEILVHSPDSDHITKKLGTSLGKSPERVRERMVHVLEGLRNDMKINKNIRVKCYTESPNFKILIFDDEMFVSSFAQGGPKNDHNAKMFQITRDKNPLFAGLERFFDDLSGRAEPLQ